MGTLSGEATVFSVGSTLNPIALRLARLLWSFGCSECSRVNPIVLRMAKGKNFLLEQEIFSFKSKRFLKGQVFNQGSKLEATKLPPFVKMTEL